MAGLIYIYTIAINSEQIDPPRLRLIIVAMVGLDNPQDDQEAVRPPGPSFVVISGGTGGNAICTAFQDATYVLPVSDDGGSSSEIIRVLGGPSIGMLSCSGCIMLLLCSDNPGIYLGDIRSRLVRLIPPGLSGSPLDAIRKLLSYRLPAHTRERQAREEWREIVEGKSNLWTGIPTDRKECIRGKHPTIRDIPFLLHSSLRQPGFLVYFENQLLIRAHKNFSYLNGRFVVYFYFYFTNVHAFTNESTYMTASETISWQPLKAFSDLCPLPSSFSFQ